MPEFWVAKVVDALNEQGKAVRGSRVLLLGVAYKKNIDDIRESPALDVIKLLHHRGAQLSYHDPHVPAVKEDGISLSSVPLTAETLRGADCVMIITDHNAVDYQLVKRHAKATVDTRHVLKREPQERA
jgi:UDP-N-acetyl-D-glucosamine dehydrogenase